MMRFRIVIVTILFCTLLPGCTESTVLAPVTEVSTIEPLPKGGMYRVQEDDTLYSIAFRYGLDYRYLAKINHIKRPYHIQMGSKIALRKESRPVKTIAKTTAKATVVKPPIIKAPAIKETLESEKEPTASVNAWQRPARGPVINTFSGVNKGINIGGRWGDPIFATAPGKVVYSGDGLRAYGNLIIIKHNSEFLSAYAHNSKIGVKEGQWVKAGQKIAEMGDTGARRVMLHFEIRRDGKPINPLSYLARK